MEESSGYLHTRSNCSSSSSDFSSDYDSGCVNTLDDPSALGHILVVWLIYGPIVLVTITGNFIVILAFIRDPAIRCRVSNCFVFSLSVADFLVGLSMIINFVWLLTDDWVLGKIPCLMWLSVDYSLSYASVLAIILISLDRYRLVTLKLKYATVQTRRRAVLSISCCWCFCLVFYPAVIVGWSPVTGEYVIDYSYDCDIESRGNLFMSLFLILLEFILPLMVLTYLNGRLYFTIRRRAKGLIRTEKESVSVQTVSSDVALTSWGSRHDCASGVFYLAEEFPKTVSATALRYKEADSGGPPSSAAGGSGLPPPGDSTSSRPMSRSIMRRHREFNKHRKAAITLSLLVGVYVLCWLPFYVKNTIVAFCDDCINYYVLEVTDNLLWCNSTINPFLYALLNRQYRRYIARVFRRLCCLIKE